MHNLLSKFGLFLVTITVCLVAGEALLRIKNSNQSNYLVETWKYSRALKQPSSDPLISHIHRPRSKGVFQNVEIAINSFGMRGPEPVKGIGGVLLLGSSATLGWGVAEKQTMRAHLAAAFSPGRRVMNGGVANYNAVRYVANFEKNLRALRPDHVVINFLYNDIDNLTAEKSNFILRRSQLALMMYHLLRSALSVEGNLAAIVARYEKSYQRKSAEFQTMEAAFARLAEIARQDDFMVTMSVIPDVHLLDKYPFGFAHDAAQRIAETHKWGFIDFLPSLQPSAGPDLWTIPGDRHPGAKAHKIMAQALMKRLR